MFSPVALFGIGIVSCVMSVGVLGSLLRSGVPGLARWMAAYAAIGVAFTLLIALGSRPAPAMIGTVNALVLAGSFLVLQGTRQFFGRPLAYRIEWYVLAAALAALAYCIFISPSTALRVALNSSLMAYARVVVALTVLRLRPARRPQYSYLLVAAMSLAGVGVHIVRGIAYGGGWEQQTTFFDPSPLNVTLLGLSILSLPCLSIGMVMLAHDRLAERMEQLATVDELTGALVRRAFIERAGAFAARIRAASVPLSIAIMDLDNFKAVNDRFGHAAGDRALACFARVVAGAIGPDDLFGRLGGEEFAVLFVSKGKRQAQQVVNELRVLLADSSANETACTFSAGIEQLEAGDALASAMARADAALYTAKAMGRNCVVSAPPAGAIDDSLTTESRAQSRL
jgi:diguanylate cyclase (GGDEF)-like protein